MTKRANDRIYISYGSNMNLQQMAYRCPGAEVIGTATLDGWRLTFQGRPGNAHANILPEEGYSTPALVWAISEAHEAALDRYEGVAGGYYRKYHMPVTVGGKAYRRALVYLMNLQPYNMPYHDYYMGIARAYMDAGIDDAPLRAANNAAWRNRGLFPRNAREASGE